MKNSNKRLTNQLLLTEMKNESYTRKEGVYANLLINVLEEANKFNKTLDYVFINHNIIESILLSNSLNEYLHDTFGRSEEEFPSRFIKACEELKEQFNSDYPHVNKYNEKHVKLYYTAICFGVKTFMRKVISRIVFPLDIQVKAQPLFVRLAIYRDGILNIAWEKGKKGGYYLMQDDCEISRNLSKSEIKLLEDQINKEVRLYGYKVLEFEDLADIIDSFIDKVA